jgi:anti-sigma factor RsiW
MNHIDDDLLMKIALELLEESDAARVQEHLRDCNDCRSRLARIRRDMELIGSLEPRIERPFIPMPGVGIVRGARGKRMTAWLTAAAALFVGFAIGFGASRLSDERIVLVVPHHVYVSPDRHTYPDFTYCESVDLADDFISVTPTDSVSH